MNNNSNRQKNTTCLCLGSFTFSSSLFFDAIECSMASSNKHVVLIDMPWVE